MRKINCIIQREGYDKNSVIIINSDDVVVKTITELLLTIEDLIDLED